MVQALLNAGTIFIMIINIVVIFIDIQRFAGSQFPKAIFPSMVGRPVLRSDEKVQGIQIKDIMVGDDASRARQNLKINLPMGMLHL